MAQLLSLLILSLALTTSPLVIANDEEQAAAVVENLHAALLQTMSQADELGYRGRYTQLDPILNEAFDFDTIARIAAGRHWKDVTPQDKAAFLDAFKRLSVATYAVRFSGFSGERFETVGVEAKRGNQLVKTALLKEDGASVSLDYLLHNKDGNWQIVNVIAEGVSDLSLKRADYTAVIAHDGMQTLVAKLNEKTASYGGVPE